MSAIVFAPDVKMENLIYARKVKVYRPKSYKEIRDILAPQIGRFNKVYHAFRSRDALEVLSTIVPELAHVVDKAIFRGYVRLRTGERLVCLRVIWGPAPQTDGSSNIEGVMRYVRNINMIVLDVEEAEDGQ